MKDVEQNITSTKPLHALCSIHGHGTYVVTHGQDLHLRSIRRCYKECGNNDLLQKALCNVADHMACLTYLSNLCVASLYISCPLCAVFQPDSSFVNFVLFFKITSLVPAQRAGINTSTAYFYAGSNTFELHMQCASWLCVFNDGVGRRMRHSGFRWRTVHEELEGHQAQHRQSDRQELQRSKVHLSCKHNRSCTVRCQSAFTPISTTLHSNLPYLPGVKGYCVRCQNLILVTQDHVSKAAPITDL